MGWPAAVLWDLDGTLVDTQKVWNDSLIGLAARLGAPLPESALTDTLGFVVEATVSWLFASLDLSPEPAALWEAERWMIQYVEERFRRGVDLLPGAQDALTHTQATGIPMALVTSTKRSLTDVILGTFGGDLFAITVCGDEVDGWNKPHPEPYLRAARVLGVDPTDCVAVEDSPTGVRSAEAAGCTVVVVPSHIAVPLGERRLFRESLVGFDLAELSFSRTVC